ncbi:condensation domain-containing protein, partial [Rheinheimera soli]
MNAVLDLLKTLNNKGIRLSIGEGDNLVLRGVKEQLTKDLLEGIKQQKAELLAILKSNSTQINDSYIEQVPRCQPLPLSFSQKRLWLIDQISGQSKQYNIPIQISFSGELNYQALERAFVDILQKHEILRTTYHMEIDSDPYQSISEVETFELGIVDLSEVENAAKYQQLTEFINQEVERSFSLSSDLMLRAKLIKENAQQHVLLMTLHHIAADGWSMRILQNDLVYFYQCHADDRYAAVKNNGTPLNIQYADYAAWQASTITKGGLAASLDYWANNLKHVEPLHGLVTNGIRNRKRNYQGKVLNQSFRIEQYKTLKEICNRYQVTMFMLLESCFAFLISQFSHRDQVVIGTPVAGRYIQSTEPLIGFFVNSLVLKSEFSPEQRFSECLAKNKEVILNAYEHQQVPFDLIVETLNPRREESYDPIFQIVFGFNQAESFETQLNNLHLSIEDRFEVSIKAKTDLELVVSEKQDGLDISWTYDCELFSADMVTVLSECYEKLLNVVCKQPECKLGDIKILPDAHLRSTLAFEKGPAHGEEPAFLLEQFISQAQAHPEHLAVREGELS